MAACTGRMFQSAMNHIHHLEFSDLIICTNGAITREVASGKLLRYAPLAKERFNKLLAIAKAHGWSVVACYNDGMYCDSWIDWLVSFRDKYKDHPNSLLKINVAQGIFDDTRFAPDKVLLIIQSPDIYEAQRMLIEEYGDIFEVAISNPPCLELTDKLATKGQALAWLCAYLNIEQRDVLAFGDSYNDLDMIKWAGTGVAMGNAIPELINIADVVTLTNNEDGVADFLEKHLL